MKKTLLVLAATAAHAEHKLLITDVLEQRQVEGQVRYEYTHAKREFSDNATGDHGTLTSNVQEGVYSVGIGLGHGLEISASVPQTFKERAKLEFDGAVLPTEYEKMSGFGDFALEAKYRLLGGHGQPTSVVAGLGVKFDTGTPSHAGTETTDVSPFIAVSRDLGHHLFPYAAYRPPLRNHDAADSHTLTVGVEKQFCPRFTLDAKVDASFNTATDKRDASATSSNWGATSSSAATSTCSPRGPTPWSRATLTGRRT